MGVPPRGAVAVGAEFEVPCWRCRGCRKDQRRAWAVRIGHEAQLYEISVVATLTYADQFLPPDLSLRYSDFQGFMKRLRRRIQGVGPGPDGRRLIRFFVAGEYGGDSGRPHFHAVLFNCWFRDQEKRGQYMYSDLANEIWGKGNVVLDYVTPQSAGYVAGYAKKKYEVDSKAFLLRKGRKTWYEDAYDARTGEVVLRRAEFCRMSLSGGIGSKWFDRYGSDLFPHDFAVVAGHQTKVPRYYLERWKKTADPVQVKEVLDRRDARAREGRADQTPERRAVREELLELQAREQERRGL